MAEMTKIRLDSGIEYECAPEVKVEIEKILEYIKAAELNAAKYEAKMELLYAAKDLEGVDEAVEAGLAAAQKLGEIIATHVIPRPHTDVEKILPSLK